VLPHHDHPKGRTPHSPHPGVVYEKISLNSVIQANQLKRGIKATFNISRLNHHEP
jgi:hypothetical protein